MKRLQTEFHLSTNEDADRQLFRVYSAHRNKPSGFARGLLEGSLEMYLNFTGLQRRFVLVRLSAFYNNDYQQ